METGAGAAGAASGAGVPGVGSGVGVPGVGSGVGEATSRRIPFSRTNLPTSADIASPATSALTCDPVIVMAFAQFKPQAATSSQLAKGSLDPLCIKK